MIPSADDHHHKAKDDGSTFEKMKILKEKYGEGAGG
jgi:hypothetical protein